MKAYPSSIIFLFLALAYASPKPARASPCVSVAKFEGSVAVEKLKLGCKDDCPAAAKAAAQNGNCDLVPSPGGAAGVAGGANLAADAAQMLGQQSGIEKSKKIDDDAIGKTKDARQVTDKLWKTSKDDTNKYSSNAVDRATRNFADAGGLKPDSTYSGVNDPSGNTPPRSNPRSPSAGAAGGNTGGPSLGSNGASLELPRATADYRLARQAQTAVQQNKRFYRDQAEQAHDPQLRRELLIVAAAQENELEMKQEDSRLGDQLSQLIALANTTKDRAANLGSLPPDASGQIDGPPLADSGHDKTEAIGRRALGRDSEESSSLEKISGGTLGGNQDNPAADAAQKLAKGGYQAPDLESRDRGKASDQKRRSSSLRDQLHTYLKGKLDGESSMMGETFNGQLKEESFISEAHGEKAKGLGDVIGSAFSTARDAAFSMRSSETDAEVNRLIESSERELASMVGTGVLGADSQDLFTRIKSAHWRCQERRCIQTN